MIKEFDMTLDKHIGKKNKKITSLNHCEFYVCVFTCDFFMHHFGSKCTYSLFWFVQFDMI